MKYFNTIFGQLLDFIPTQSFKRIVGQHKTDHASHKYTSWNQLVVLLFAQAHKSESLREIERSLRCYRSHWYHLGIHTVSKSTISKRSSQRTYKIFEQLFYEILSECKHITASRIFSFDNPLYSLDSTTISLCIDCFNTTTESKRKGAFKLHVLLNNRSLLPEIIIESSVKTSDIFQAQRLELSLPMGSILVFDRGYLDYIWWNTLMKKGYFFVSRIKKNTIYIIHKELSPTHPDILRDCMVWIGDPLKSPFEKPLRMVIFKDNEYEIHKRGPRGGVYYFITNNEILSDYEIARIYKDRWQIEIFFKWIKQNLVIQTFYGTTKNAIMSQIWVSMIYYLLLSYIKFQTRYSGSILEFTWVVRSSLFIRRSIIDLLSLDSVSVKDINELHVTVIQDSLF